MAQVVRDLPGPGQESVWDYPRPPRLEPAARRVRITLGGIVIVDTHAALRVLETSHPPAYYVPMAALSDCELRPESRTTVCEFKGYAVYWTLRAGNATAEAAGWSYPDPLAPYLALRDHVSVYPGRMDACHLDDERVSAQPGDFYGGWLTADIVGPVKGGPGTWGW